MKLQYLKFDRCTVPVDQIFIVVSKNYSDAAFRSVLGHSDQSYIIVIYIKNIMVMQSMRKELKGEIDGHDDDPQVQFDCDNYYNGHNCHVELEKLQFVGYNFGAKMTCKGTVGTTKYVNGINNCLR